MEVKAKFDHFNVNVTDLNRSIEFYSKALGFTEARRKEAPMVLLYWCILQMEFLRFCWNSLG